MGPSCILAMHCDDQRKDLDPVIPPIMEADMICFLQSYWQVLVGLPKPNNVSLLLPYQGLESWYAGCHQGPSFPTCNNPPTCNLEPLVYNPCQPRTTVRLPTLDCYLVGSLDFKFLGSQGVSTKPPQKVKLFAEGSAATKNSGCFNGHHETPTFEGEMRRLLSICGSLTQSRPNRLGRNPVLTTRNRSLILSHTHIARDNLEPGLKLWEAALLGKRSGRQADATSVGVLLSACCSRGGLERVESRGACELLGAFACVLFLVGQLKMDVVVFFVSRFFPLGLPFQPTPKRVPMAFHVHFLSSVHGHFSAFHNRLLDFCWPELNSESQSNSQPKSRHPQRCDL